MQRYLLFANELYALPILRPLAQAIHASHGEVAWFVSARLAKYLNPDERRLRNAAEIQAFAPAAVFSASNWVPHFFPGAKVQVFHGFNVEKRAPGRGHFRIRNLFDLYCTQGPATTAPFRDLAAAHRHFAVVETGWPKLDPLFAPRDAQARALRPPDGRPVCMYAATFTEKLSSARALHAQIAQQVASGERYWLLTLHPKSDVEIVERYRALAGDNARYLEAVDLVPMMRAADVLVSDTSSVVSEFVVQGKPVITLRNRAPKSHMLDIAEPEHLENALRTALTPPAELLSAIRDYSGQIHPQRDGRSSERVLAAAESFLRGELGTLAPKPLNLWRKLQGRLRYFQSANFSTSD
ncbi:MAG: CDP-glycerol glycerophosphotransferase family protein [Tahibacter sp.]